MRKNYLAPETTVVLLDMTEQILAGSTVIKIASEETIDSNSDLGGNKWNRSKGTSLWDDFDDEE